MNDLDPKGLEAATGWFALGPDQMPVSDMVTGIIRAYLSAVPDGEGELVEVADALTEFSDIDEAEGGNPHVIATERRAATLLREAASRLSQAGVDRGALKRIHRKLAEEGGGTWATYMMLEIAAAYGDLELVPEPLSGDTL